MQKMDFMALTEHNQVPFGFKNQEVLLIPSFELTTPLGHLNIHRVKEPDFLGDTGLLLEDPYGWMNRMAEKHRSYSNISMNHLFLVPWQFDHDDFDLTSLHTLEVICDPTYPESAEANDKAVRFLDFLWNRGHKIYGIGGSDSHNLPDEPYKGSNLPSIFGDPATHVYCEGLSVDNVILGIQRGNAYVARYVELEIIIGEGRLPGQKLDSLSEFDYSVRILNFKDPHVNDMYIGRFILNGDILFEKGLTPDDPRITLKHVIKTIEEKADAVPSFFWLRFGLYDRNGHVHGFVNPIYYGDRACSEKKFGKLVEEFNHLL